MEIIVNCGCGDINRGFLGCESQGFFAFVEGYNFVIRIVLTDCLCNRTADKTKPDKSDFVFHDVSSLYDVRLKSVKIIL